MTTQTPAKRAIRRDRGAAANSAPVTTTDEAPKRIPSLREPLITYEQGFVAALPVTGRKIYNAKPYQEEGGEPNPPYHQFSPGMPGYLVRVRDVPEDFPFPANGGLVCTFKVMRVTDFNPDGSVKRVTIAVTGMPTDAQPTHRLKATGNASGVVLGDGVQLCPIDDNSAVLVTQITQ